MIQIYYFDIQKHIEILKKGGKEYLRKEDLQKVKANLRGNKEDELIASGWVKRYVFEKILKKRNYQKELYKGKYGKPYMKDNSFSFNKSDSKDFIVFGICESTSIGVDIEKKREFPGPAVKGFFCDAEWRFLLNCQNDFIRIWARKEAYFKCVGTGWNEKTECSALKECIMRGEKNYCLKDMDFLRDTVLSICYEDRGQKEVFQIEEITDFHLCQLRKLGLEHGMEDC